MNTSQHTQNTLICRRLQAASLKRSASASFLGLLLAVASIHTPCAQAQAMSRASAQDHIQIVNLASSASVQVTQDLLAIQLAATRDGSDAQAVQTQLKSLLDAAITSAKAQAAPGQLDVRTGNFSLYPRYDNKGKISGWQGSAELVLEGRDFARISAVAGKIQGLTIQNVAFSLSRAARQKAESELQDEAIERFKSKAQSIAKSFGFSGFILREVSVTSADQGFVPQPRMVMMQARSAEVADAAVPAEAGKTMVTVSVTGSVQLR